MIAEISFLAIYVCILLLPGYILQFKLKLDLNWFLSSLSISYTLFALLFVAANYFSVSANFFIIGYSALTLACFGYFIIRLLVKRPAFNDKLKPILTILLCSTLYQSIFGSFTEVPADLYAHLERYQYALKNISQDKLGFALSLEKLFFQKSGVFYYLIAAIASITGVSAESIVANVDFANRTLFIISIYFFTKTIFQKSSNPKVIAGVACVFLVLHMGINVFAYIRYYSLAPTMLNMVIYFSAVSLFIQTIKSNKGLRTVTSYFLIFLFAAAASTVHVQEAMYIGIIIGTVSAIAVLSKFSFVGFDFQTNTTQVVTITAFCVIAFIGIYTYSHLNLSRAPNAHWRLWEFGAGYGLVPDFTTLNLKFQFSRVITLWGVLVFGLFFLNINRFKSNIFIMAGMLSPLVTILNPFFVDLFLRHYNSTTLWRLCFILPIHFVAADLFVYYIEKLKQSTLIAKIFSACALVFLIILLLPIKNTWQGIHYSRFPTLAATKQSLSHHHYKDLISKLDSLDKPYQILTDPMTGYMVSAMTKHTNTRDKFFRGYYFDHFTFENYDDSPLIKYKDHLIITNQRQQSRSRIGELSNHWTKDQWQKKHHYYTPELMAHLVSHPLRFSKLWDNEGVAIYQIN